MTVIDKDLVKFVFDYIYEFKEYEDKEELYTAGLITDEEYKVQLKFEEFVFGVLKICAREKKYYHDSDSDFENYTMYLRYKSQQIKVFVMYGQGNYFYLNKRECDFREELELNLENVVY